MPPVISKIVTRASWAPSVAFGMQGGLAGKSFVGELWSDGGDDLELLERAPIVFSGTGQNAAVTPVGAVWWSGTRLARAMAGVSAVVGLVTDAETETVVWGDPVDVATTVQFGRGTTMRQLFRDRLAAKVAGEMRVLTDVWGRPDLLLADEVPHLKGALVEVGVPRFAGSDGASFVARTESYEVEFTVVATSDDVSEGFDRLDLLGALVREALDTAEGLGIGMGVPHGWWRWSAGKPQEASRLVSQALTLRVDLGRR